MKKILILLVLMTFLLSACGSETPVDEELEPDMVATVVAEMMAATTAAQVEVEAQATVAPTESPTEVPVINLSADFENAAPIQTQFIVGILKLEGTAQAITAEQAALLSPYLLSLQSMMMNNTLTEENITALMLQELSTLTVEQIQSIINMQITQDSIITTMEELGMTMMQGGQGGGGGGGAPADGGQGGGGGQGRGGGQGGGGAPAGGTEQLTGGVSVDGEGQEEHNGFVSPELLDAIISLLESKV